MKRLSILILSILMVCAAGGYLTAFDYGGSLSSISNFSTDDAVGIANEEALGLWLQSGKGEHYSFEMKMDLIASFTDDGFSFYLHPDFLKLDSLYKDLEYGPSVFASSLGRFTTSDFTGKIFSQKLDGMIWNLNYPALELTIAAGSTGLMFADNGVLAANTSSTILSKTDAFQAAEGVGLFEYLADPDAGSTLLASPRAVEIITLTFPQVIARQEINLSMIAQEDLRPMIDIVNGYFDDTYVSPLIQEGETVFDPERGGSVDTFYVGAGVSGPSIPSLYHNVYYYFGTGQALTYTGQVYQYDTIISHMAGLSVDYFMEWFFNSKAGIGATFGSGDADAQGLYEGNMDGYYTQFTPITSGGGGMIFSSGISNIITGNLNYSIKPFEWLPIPFIQNMQIAAAYMPFFRVVDGPTAVSGISPDYSGNYLGSEIDLTMNMRPYSDLGIIVQAGYFLPDANAFEGSAMAEPTFMAKLNVSMSF